MAFYYGISGSARKVDAMYIGIDGVARKVKAAYIGVDGQARLFFGGEYVPAINEIVQQCAGQGSSIVSDVIYPAGRYRVEIAGNPATDSAYDSDNGFTYEASVTQPFTIRGYCGCTSIMDDLGFVYGDSCNGGIFGGGAGKDGGYAATAKIGDGNSLSAYGAVCHFIPVGGTFGTNYLFCFHCAPSPKGGAYGGGAGGRGARYRNPGGSLSFTNASGSAGGAGAGGAGGAGGYGTISGSVGSGSAGNPGNSGSGIGGGTATKGGVAVYNGLIWTTPTRANVSRNASFIKVTYLGVLNS